MRNQRIHHSIWMMSVGFLILVIAGCASFLSEQTSETPASTSTKEPAIHAAVSALPTQREVAAGKNILYQDDFTNPATDWPEEKVDNYYIGYHEPEYYHVQLLSPSFKYTVYAPNKKVYEDVTVQLDVLTEVAWEGDFRYGLIFRRSGDLYYAFTISPTTKKWSVLKSTSDSLKSLKAGTYQGIQGVGSEDTLRVDAKGDTFSFYINDKQVVQISDPDYASGEVGLFTQTLDSRSAHVHFNGLVIRDFEATQIQASSLYRDDFTNPASGWPKEKLDNYFIGYHDPEYYQVQFLSANFKYPIYAPNKKVYKDITVQLKVLTEIAWPGDFRYGLIFRRTGDLFYAFIISPNTKKWYVLKSNSDGLQPPLGEGVQEGIQGVGREDTLRVDAKGGTFYFHINDKQVAQISDADYASGEVGLFVRTLDSRAAHIHFDELIIWDFQTPLLDTSSPLGTENCTNGADEDGDNLIDAADSDCANVSISIDHHNGANGAVSATNCSRCHSFPGSPPPTASSSNSGPAGNNAPASDHHNGANGPVSVGNCSGCHSLPWPTPPPAVPNNPNGVTATMTPTRQKPNPHPPLNPASCVLCHANGIPTLPTSTVRTPTAGSPTSTVTASSPGFSIPTFTPTRVKPNPHPPPGQSCNVCHTNGIPTPVTPPTNTPEPQISNTPEPLPITSTPEPPITNTSEPPPTPETPSYP